MAKPQIITEIEHIILQWNETSIGNGDFGATAFLYRAKEFGHIHQNLDLDIVFGKQITAELLQRNLVQKHLYVPETSISYHVSNEEKLQFACSLLRFSYLIHFKNAHENENGGVADNVFESEMAKLPESLSSIYLKLK